MVLPQAEYDRLRSGDYPALPAADSDGNYPAVEALRVSLARKIIKRRHAAGLSQVELARRAGVRAETINRLEQAKHTPSIATLEKLQRVLDAAEREPID